MTVYCTEGSSYDDLGDGWYSRGCEGGFAEYMMDVTARLPSLSSFNATFDQSRRGLNPARATTIRESTSL